MKPQNRILTILLLWGVWAGSVRGQIPTSIETYKGIAYAQKSASEISVYRSRFTVSATVEPSRYSLIVSLRGLASPLQLAPTTPGEFHIERQFLTAEQLEAALPDGPYRINVDDNSNPPTNTALTISSGPRIAPPLITNFDELQNLDGGAFRISWRPIADGLETDYVAVLVFRPDGSQLFSSPNPGAPSSLNGRSTFVDVPSLSVAPDELLGGALVFFRPAITTANGGRTRIAAITGFETIFLMRRLAVNSPLITAQPQSVIVTARSTAVLNVATSSNQTTYQWRKDGANISGATGARLVLRNVLPSDTGEYSVSVANNAGSVTSASATVSLSSSALPARITNLSVRTTASRVMPLVVGFVAGGLDTTGTKPLLVRAVGPSLAQFGLPGTMPDPQLQLFSDSTVILSNNGWGGNAQVATVSANVGAFSLASAASRDAALYLPSLAPGAYTAQIAGGFSLVPEMVLAEIYDATPSSTLGPETARLLNVSARSMAGTGGNLLIAGFTIDGPVARTVLIRGVGPGLSKFGVSGALFDPHLALYRDATKLLENDDWDNSGDLSATFDAVGAFKISPGSDDSALLVTLPPGSYTAQVKGVSDKTGIALVEVYEVP